MAVNFGLSTNALAKLSFFSKGGNNCYAACLLNCTDQTPWSPLTQPQSYSTNLSHNSNCCAGERTGSLLSTWALNAQTVQEIEGVWDVNTLRESGGLTGDSHSHTSKLLASPILPILVYLSSRDVIELNKASCYWRAAAAAAVYGTGRRGAILECCYICF